jgi:hypothetical protein
MTRENKVTSRQLRDSLDHLSLTELIAVLQERVRRMCKADLVNLLVTLIRSGMN